MADEFRFGMFLSGAGRRRYVQLAVTALMVLGVVALLAALVRPVFAHRTLRYVSLINQGQVQVCRVTAGGPICPPLSFSLSKSYSPSKSKSKSASPSKSVSTGPSLVPPSKSVSTSTSLSSSVRAQ
jgi:hypothetical protein